MDDASVHVIDDAQEVRDSLSVLLQTVGYRVRTFASALEFLAVVRPGWSGCVIADVRMPAMDGVELIKELLLRGINLPVIVITAHSDVPVAVAALKAGAVDFIEKPFRDEILLASLRTALSSPQAQGSSVVKPDTGIGARLAALSPREHEVALLLAAGHANKVIAARLGISPRTVEVHRANIMEKLGAKTLADLVRLVCLFDSSGQEQR
ncbi:MAG: response regulator [Hyphomicrobium sp.]|jgi:two-component system response regulator FixJ